jgi:hypothetical protein
MQSGFEALRKDIFWKEFEVGVFVQLQWYSSRGEAFVSAFCDFFEP